MLIKFQIAHFLLQNMEKKDIHIDVAELVRQISDYIPAAKVNYIVRGNMSIKRKIVGEFMVLPQRPS
jgi:hypothetical protein